MMEKARNTQQRRKIGDNADLFLSDPSVSFRLTCHYEGSHDANGQRCSFVDEGLGQKMSQCQHKGPQGDVIEPAGASVTDGQNM